MLGMGKFFVLLRVSCGVVASFCKRAKKCLLHFSFFVLLSFFFPFSPPPPPLFFLVSAGSGPKLLIGFFITIDFKVLHLQFSIYVQRCHCFLRTFMSFLFSCSVFFIGEFSPARVFEYISSCYPKMLKLKIVHLHTTVLICCPAISLVFEKSAL